MVNLFLIFTGSFITAFSGAIVPGPLLFYTIAKSHKHGVVTGFLVIFGHAILELILVLVLLFGIKSFLNKGFIEIIVSYIGGFILLIMGILMIVPVLKDKLDIKNKEYSNLKKNKVAMISAGFFMSLSNPYFLIWWLFIGAGYLFSALKYGYIGIFFFFIGHILADLIWYVFVAFCIDKGKKIFKAKFYKYLIITCSILVFFIGGYFVYNGFKLSF